MKRLILGGITLLALMTACRQSETTVSETAPETTTQTATTQTTAATETTATDTAAPSTAPVGDHDVTGGYFPIEPLPAEMAELNFLSLATIDENAAPAPLNGFLRPKEMSAEDYKMIAPKLEGNRLTFTTAKVGSVEYAFEGTFAQLANFPQNPPDVEAAVLTGALTKKRDGKTVATTPVRFRYEGGD